MVLFDHSAETINTYNGSKKHLYQFPALYTSTCMFNEFYIALVIMIPGTIAKEVIMENKYTTLSFCNDSTQCSHVK